MADAWVEPPLQQDPVFASTGPQGHRARMRVRLLGNGPGGLADYELLEMLLFLSIPRRDTKPLAKTVINYFGDLYRSLSGQPGELRRAGLDPASIGIIDLVREAARRLATAQSVSRPLLNNMPGLTEYLDVPARLQRPPHLAVLFLNNRNQLLADISFAAAQSPADIAQAVARRALEIHATALILATFRLGTLPAADERDRDVTRRVAKFGKALSIALHDHMIFGDGASDSLKRRGLI